jgi:hypothetical protein
MGLRNALRLLDTTDDVSDPRHGSGPMIASPWSTGSLESLIWTDLGFDVDLIPPTRREAMRIPAFARARNIIATTLARLPLIVLAGDVELPAPPSWPTRTDQLSSPFHRMLWTIDDHLFYGESLWSRTNGVDGFPLSMSRVPYWDWQVDDDRRILVDGVPQAADQVVFLPGPHEGVLDYGDTAIRAATITEANAQATAARPFRVELHQTTDEPLSDDDIARLVARCKAALATNDGILFTNNAVEAKVHPFDSSQLLVEGRNANDVNMARLASIPAALVDATSAGSSLTYETIEGRNQQAVDYGFAAYAAAICARLSMDDIVPRGQRVVFDLADLVGLHPAATGPTLTD